MVIELDITQGTLVLVGFGLVQFLFSVWLKARLVESINYEYNEKIEELKFSQVQRQKAAVVAKLFAKWIKYRGHEKDWLNNEKLIEYYEELNRMSIETSLWVKDGEFLNEAMSLFFLEKDKRPDERLILGKFRKLVLGVDDDKFKSKNIVLWPNEEIAKELFKVK
jgi:hypothetical protein